MLVAGVGIDVLINTFFFLAGVIPGHIHGFYVTWTYFSRKRKVNRGKYPGGPKPFIYSKRVINGDASDERVGQLWREEQRAKEEKLRRRGSSRWGMFNSGSGSGGGSGGGGGGSNRMTAQGPIGRQASSRRQDSTVNGYTQGLRSPRP